MNWPQRKEHTYDNDEIDSYKSGWNACLDQCTKVREGENSLIPLDKKKFAQALYDLIYFKEKPPSGKEVGCWMEIQSIANTLCDYFGAEKGLEALDTHKMLDTILEVLNKHKVPLTKEGLQLLDEVIGAVIARFGTRKDGRDG